MLITRLSNKLYTVLFTGFFILFSHQTIATIQPINIDESVDGKIDQFSIKQNSTGEFVAVWTKVLLEDADQYYTAVFARKYDADFKPKTEAFRVNTFSNGNQSSPDVAFHENGGFTVVWNSLGQIYYYDIYARNYDKESKATSVEYLINSFSPSNISTSSKTAPSVSSNKNNIIITWKDGSFDSPGGNYNGIDGSEGGIVMQQFDYISQEVNGYQVVNTTTIENQTSPHISATSNGVFFITWVSNGDIYAQLFDNTGNRIESELILNEVKTGYQNFPKSSIDVNGNIFVTWQTISLENNASDIFKGRCFNSNAQPLTDEFEIAENLLEATTSSLFNKKDGGFIVITNGKKASNEQGVIYFKEYDTQCGETASGEMLALVESNFDLDRINWINAEGTVSDHLILSWSQNDILKAIKFEAKEVSKIITENTGSSSSGTLNIFTLYSFLVLAAFRFFTQKHHK